jgi:DNA-binding GntR family transcriptional regulator
MYTNRPQIVRHPSKASSAQGEGSRLGVRVYEHLRRGIFGGEYGAGQRVSDVAIAKTLRVSRTPVREAMLRLEQDGLLSRDRPRRVVVSTIAPKDVADIYPIVAVLEGLAGWLATPQLTAADLKELRALDRRMQIAAQALDVTTFFQANAAFHDVFIKRANNPRLENEIGTFRLLMRRFRVFLMKIPGRMAMSVDEHGTIIRAFAAKDARQVEAAVRKHIHSAEHALRQALDAVSTLA